MKIKELINYGKSILRDNEVEDANIIAKVLTQYILKMSREQLIINENNIVREDDELRYCQALEKIIYGIPIQYITNHQEFMKLNFHVDENVLIPQPDTEILVEEVIKICKKENKIDILDICTGSGAIGISLAYYLKNAKITLSDISKKALKVASKNVKINKVDVNTNLIESNMFENINNTFDIIVSNPPYIESNIIKKLSNQVKSEPIIALDGGEDGLRFYKILIEQANNYLKEDGYLCIEIGYNQKEKIEKLIKENGNYKEVICLRDLGGNDRVIICKKNN